MATGNPQWRKMKDIPSWLSDHGVSSRWTPNSFVIAPDCLSGRANGVHMYNAITEQWSMLIPYFNLLAHFTIYDIAIDPTRKKLFLRTDDRTGYLMVAEPAEQTLRRVLNRKNALCVRESVAISYIANEIHFFGADSHQKWNGQTGNGMNFEILLADSWEEAWGITNWRYPCRFVNVPSKGMVLVIGGRGAPAHRGDGHGYDFEIWKYEVATNEWSGTGISFEFWRPTAVLTPSENFVILAGGHKFRTNEFGEYVHVLDMQDKESWQLYQTQVCIPKDVDHHLAVTGDLVDDHLVFGWTRRLFQQTTFHHMAFPPMYLLQMICSWITCAELHWVRRPTGMWSANKTIAESHQVIALSQILRQS